VPEEFWANAVFSVTPTILVGLIFWFTMRGIFRADRTERRVYAEVEAQERARMGMPPAAASVASPSVASASVVAPSAVASSSTVASSAAAERSASTSN
jgi:hypothetical protein